MKAQTTAIVALLAILALALASTSAVTYSWWSDSEDAEIEITSGYLKVDVGNIKFADGIGSTFDINTDFTAANDFDSFNNIKIRAVGETHRAVLMYDVVFETTINAQYKISIDAIINGANVSVANSAVGSTADPFSWTQLNSTDGTTVKHEYTITSFITLTDAEMGINDGKLKVENLITQFGAVDETDVPMGDSVIDDINTLGTNGDVWNVGVKFTDVSKASVLNVEIDSVADSGNNFTIKLSFDDGATFDSATVSIIIPGGIPSGTVVYLGDGSQPADVSITTSGTDSILTFTTDHFSEFMFFDRTIDSVDEFVKFGDMVTEYGATFEGQEIVLSKDLDLNGIVWTPIGNDDNKFMGTFNGNNKTISNLKVDSIGSPAGLFGILNGIVKDLTVSGADVTGGSSVGVIAGSIFKTGIIDNVVVKDAVVNGNHWVGGISGFTYGSVTDCTVTGATTITVTPNEISAGVFDNGDKAGGIIGYLGEGKYTVTGNKVIGTEGAPIVIKAYRDIGGIIGAANSVNTGSATGNNNTVSGNSVEHVTIVIDQETGNYGDKDSNVGNIIGRYLGTSGSAVDSTYSNVICQVSSAKPLVDAMKSDIGYIMMTDDIALDANKFGESNGYGKTGINVKNGQTIDGNEKILTVNNAWGTWGSAISTTGGEIKDITITGCMRGIFINHNSDYSEKVVLNNVTIDGTVYTISCDQGKNQGLEATNCTFNGWTSFAATIGEVKFTGCAFGEGSGYNFSRPYAPTTYVNCTFEAGHQVDPRASVTLKNCTLDGVSITTENLSTLVIDNIANATVKN